MSKQILLSNGECAIVDDADWLFLVGFNWSVSGYGYSYVTIDKEPKYMHHIVAERARIDCSNMIDHINGNKLDNRRCNLRAATSSQNTCNARKRQNNRSGIKGVIWYKRHQKWRAEIMVDGKRHFLGHHNTKEAAAFAYEIAAKKYHKEFACFG